MVGPAKGLPEGNDVLHRRRLLVETTSSENGVYDEDVAAREEIFEFDILLGPKPISQRTEALGVGLRAITRRSIEMRSEFGEEGGAVLVLGVVGGVGREGGERDVVVGGEDDGDGLDSSRNAVIGDVLLDGLQRVVPGRLGEGRAVLPERFDRGERFERGEGRKRDPIGTRQPSE